MTDLLDTITSEVSQRRDELKPLVAEYDLLVAGAAALESGEGSSPRGGGHRREKPADASGPTSSTHAQALVTRRPVGRPVGTGKRSDQALAAIIRQPGMTLPELAKAIDVHLTYLYRVVPGLVNAGKVVRDGKRYWPA